MKLRVVDLIPGTYVLNGSGDLGFYAELRKHFCKEVEVIKKCKSGLYYIKTEDRTFHTVPKSNLEVPEEYAARLERYRNRTPEDIQREREELSKWTIEPVVDIQTQHGLDLEDEITRHLIVVTIAGSE